MLDKRLSAPLSQVAFIRSQTQVAAERELGSLASGEWSDGRRKVCGCCALCAVFVPFVPGGVDRVRQPR